MAEWARKTPWRQGDLLTHDARESLGLFHRNQPDDTIIIVASHDCDIAQSPTKEPMVELIIGRRINKLDGNFTHAKTARTIHIEFEGGTSFLAEFVASDKCNISKMDLNTFKPCSNQSLSPSNLATFQRWLATRYCRSAFPDEFERRLVHETKMARKIANLIKPLGNIITAVLFDVDEGSNVIRKGQDDLYVLDITLLYSIEVDFKQAESNVTILKKSIETAFRDKFFNMQTKKWQNIELRYCDALSEEALTYRQFCLMKPWRLDHISLAADPQQSIPQ